MNVREIPVSLLRAAPWNANRVPPSLLEKVRRSMVEFGMVEHLVTRPHPCDAGCFEVISGNHRLRLLQEMGVETAPVVTRPHARAPPVWSSCLSLCMASAPPAPTARSCVAASPTRKQSPASATGNEPN